jgi:hypothetical protein
VKNAQNTEGCVFTFSKLFYEKNSRREYMFIGNNHEILSNPEGIVCKKCRDDTYNPFGIET